MALFRLPSGGDLAGELEAKGPLYSHLTQAHNSPPLLGQSDFLMDLSVSLANSLQRGLEAAMLWHGLRVLVVEYGLLVRSPDLHPALQCTKSIGSIFTATLGHVDTHFNYEDTEIYRKAVMCPTSHINALGHLLVNMPSRLRDQELNNPLTRAPSVL